MRDDFAIFILTNGRPDNVVTLDTLRRAGYTGRTYLIIDDEDPTGPEYRERYGEQVIEFSKDEIGKTFDDYDNSPDRRSITWARNACWPIARDLDVRYFIQFDDDYTAFLHRRPGKRDGVLGYHGWSIRNLDRVLEAMVEFIASTPAATLAMSQGGDHMGGGAAGIARHVWLWRKAMNSFVCDVENPIEFRGRFNEDVNTYVGLGQTGTLFFTYTALQLNQLPSQSNPGGISELYLANGTYVKAFYTVMTNPSAVTIRTMGRSSRRLHHHIDWGAAVPKIIRQEHQKEAVR